MSHEPIYDMVEKIKKKTFGSEQVFNHIVINPKICMESKEKLYLVQREGIPPMINFDDVEDIEW